jgi:aspartyl-tRNA(Asn)/glutamyl-tRNA(Gln) amidotransferase subunit C
MKITPAEIAHVAALANLNVPPEETGVLAAQLSRIVEYMEKLNELETTGVEGTAHVVRGPSSEHEDIVEPRQGTGDAARGIGLFKVPRVISGR